MKLLRHHAESVADGIGESFADRARHWFRCEAPWFLASLTGHVVVVLALLLVFGQFVEQKPPDDVTSIEEAYVEPYSPAPRLEHLVIDTQPPESRLEPTDIDLTKPVPVDPSNDSPATDYFPGGKGGDPLGDISQAPAHGSLSGNAPFKITTLGGGPLQSVIGTPGPAEGPGRGLGGPSRKDIGKATGMTPQSERAVAMALLWLSRHQMPDGSWSLRDFDKRCTDVTCTGHGEATTDTGATALGLLPFLAAGQTHVTKCAYQTNVTRALYYLIAVQSADGDLKGSSKGNAHMYAHGLAAIALCEAYALSQDKAVGRAAQKSIDFIVAAQNAGTGGWRYEPGQEGDTSVVAWQVMALKSAQMAYLNVPKSAFDGAEKWLQSCGHGHYGEQFSYQPDRAATASMSAAGLLCSEYLHLKRDDPQLRGGVEYLLQHLPVAAERDSYYWYYATQMMHNLPGPEWDVWNRAMRKLLIETQAKEGCAAGSWDPLRPSADRWGPAGGRLMITSLCCLTLEVYYRHLPLYRLDKPNELKPGL